MTLSMTWPEHEAQLVRDHHGAHWLPRRAHQIVTILLMNRGRLIDREDLILMLWPGEDGPPLSADNIIHKFVGFANKLLGYRAIVSEKNGYRIDRPRPVQHKGGEGDTI